MFYMNTDSYYIEASKHLNYTCIDSYHNEIKDSIDLKLDFYDRITDKYLGGVYIKEYDIDTILDIFDQLLDNYYEDEYFIHVSGSIKVMYSDEYNNIYLSDMDILPVGLNNQKYISLQVSSKGGGATKVFTSIRNFNFLGTELEELYDKITAEFYSI